MRRRRREDDHDIAHEPALNGVGADEPDASEARAERALARERRADGEDRDAALHSVHNELVMGPGGPDGKTMRRIDRDWSCDRCGYNLRGLVVGEPCPECGYVQWSAPASADTPGYARWLAAKTATVRSWQTVATVALLAVAGGAWAVLGALWAGWGGVAGIVIVGPVSEEVMKIALAAVVVETRPYLFRRPTHIWAAALGSGLGFAVIENLLYLFVYVPNPSPLLVAWRWSICTALHVSCTAIAAAGLARVWRRAMAEQRPPNLAIALPMLVAAVVVHGLYNASVLVLELSGFHF